MKKIKMNEIKIQNQRVLNNRNYYFISIPKALIDTNIVSCKKVYTVLLKEQEEGDVIIKNDKNKHTN